MNEVVIVSAVRTPIGSFGGTLAALSATELGAAAIRAAVQRAGIRPEEVEEVIMGNVVSANLGQAPARQATLKAGLPTSVRCTTVNKVCASGTKAIMFAAQAIQLGQADVVVAGGMESMSNAPYYISKARFGYRYGNGELIDGLAKDGLLDPFDHCAMGIYADLTAKTYNVSREAQDEYAMRSYRRSAENTDNGRFGAEIVPVEVKEGKITRTVAEDEEFRKVDFEKIPNLKPSFMPDGTVTAANASNLSDGASALVVMSRKKADELGLKPLARILGYADAEQIPAHFPTSPVLAIPAALKRADVRADQVDFFEINEAFAVVPIVCGQLLEIPEEKLNVFGGAVSMGHPLGASGARIVTTLTNVLAQENGKIGAVGICHGGGGASALVIEKL
ncbi:acetyl-CoA C-acyltransferase [Larkinella soli]|uniref:acetyl-CoA C-acyltransferase n=1 Tax=Larkinella soli TaxID=1770527 RepID=UPI000FFC7EEA|nr:acetyl-CoA C-acyltransferase [Larkinella soli]